MLNLVLNLGSSLPSTVGPSHSEILSVLFLRLKFFTSSSGSNVCGRGCIGIDFDEVDRWLKGQSFTSAELFIYHQDTSDNGEPAQYELYTVNRHGHCHHLISTFNTSAGLHRRGGGWHVANITHKLLSQIRRSPEQREFRLIIQRMTGTNRIASRYAIPSTVWPVLMISKPKPIFSRSSLSRRRRSLEASIDCQHSSSCCLKQIAVNQSSDAGLHFLSPTSFYFYYCAGHCGPGEIFIHGGLIILSLCHSSITVSLCLVARADQYHQQVRKTLVGTSDSCCHAVDFTPFPVRYETAEDTIVESVVLNLIAKTCECS